MKPDVIDRLDALAGKRRSFVAQGAAETESPRQEDDDLPILTEVFDISEVSGDHPNNLTHTLSDPLLESIAAELTHAVQQRMTSDLPVLLDEALSRLAKDLRQGIHQISEAAIRDYLARRRQLTLPLDEKT